MERTWESGIRDFLINICKIQYYETLYTESSKGSSAIIQVYYADNEEFDLCASHPFAMFFTF